MEQSLYNGRVIVRLSEPSHIYTVSVDGSKFVRKPSVTGIKIKDKSEFLIPWALESAAKKIFALLEKKIKLTDKHIVEAMFASEEEKDKAADLGSKIHSWIEQHIKFKLKHPGIEEPGMPDEDAVALGVSAFLAWEKSHHVEYIWSEKIVYSIEHDIVGKADFAAIVDGVCCLCDIKSGNGLYNEVRLQTAGYALMDFEENGTKYNGRWAIRVAKETEEEYYQRQDFKNVIKQWLGKKPMPIKPYQVFEAYFLDLNGTELKEDQAAFVRGKQNNDWDKAAKFEAQPTE